MIALQARYLVRAIEVEHGIGACEARRLALAAWDRTYRFIQPEALDSVMPDYEEADLPCARRYVGQIGEDTSQWQYVGSRQAMQQLCGVSRVPPTDALAHAFLERGLQSASGCFSQLFLYREPHGMR